jgi:hypothetical protein
VSSSEETWLSRTRIPYRHQNTQPAQPRVAVPVTPGTAFRTGSVREKLPPACPLNCADTCDPPAGPQSLADPARDHDTAAPRDHADATIARRLENSDWSCAGRRTEVSVTHNETMLPSNGAIRACRLSPLCRS